MLNSLDIEGRPQVCAVVVAMSGGVGQSVTAAYSRPQGHDVIGEPRSSYDLRLSDASQVRAAPAMTSVPHRVAESIGIPHYVLDYEDPVQESGD